MPREWERRFNRLHVVKLGGSVITDKESAFTPRVDFIRKIARLFKLIIEEGYKLVTVLGGGSYGHTVVAILEETGYKAPEALSLISQSMIELSMLVADILHQEGVWSMIYPPHSFCSPVGLKPNCDWEVVARGLAVGVVPLVYGDAYPTREGYLIVSGDELAVEAACRLGASRVVYISSVEGVLDEKGKPIETLRANDIPALLEKGLVSGSRFVDVTGGMKRKLKAIYENRCPGLKAFITSAETINTYMDLLSPRKGTLITA
ncbi:MAG: isopentenyl phosphate kinase [Pyrodictiaceae archaeon]